jgi:hypothetical protein
MPSFVVSSIHTNIVLVTYSNHRCDLTLPYCVLQAKLCKCCKISYPISRVGFTCFRKDSTPEFNAFVADKVPDFRP